MNLSNVFAEIRINEVYAKTTEFVEIYNSNNENLNLSEWKIKDENSNDNITCFNIPNCSLITNVSYFIIIGETTNISSITSNEISYFRVSDSYIGSGLNNDGDNISFFNSIFSTNFSYNKSTDKKSWQYYNTTTWLECSPTPGTANNCTTTQNTSTPANPTTPELSLDMTWNEEDIINGDEFEVKIKTFNLEDETYNVKVWIKFEDNDTTISDRYGENNNGTDVWLKGYTYWAYNFFEGPGNKTEDIKLRIRDEYKTYHGDAKIFFLLSTGEEISKDIEILEKDEDNQTQTDEIEETSQEIVTTNNSEIKKIIKLGSNLETTNKVQLEANNPIVYESSNEKIKKYAVFGFAGLCLVITILALFNKLN